MIETIIFLHAFCCFFLTGFIWLVQTLVYPNFQLVGKGEFQNFHETHMRKITWVVAPVMLLELATGIFIFIHKMSLLQACNLFSIFLIWMWTFFINVPSHDKLQYEIESSKKALVYLNWPRTIIWTFRSFFWLWILSFSLSRFV